MKVLFVTGPSPPTVFWVPPLATALRNAGHDVLMATVEELTPIAEQMAIPFVTVTDRTLESLLSTDREGRSVDHPESLEDQVRFHGTWLARLAAASIDRLLALADHWRPDAVIGGTSNYAAGLLAAHLDIPHVRHQWDFLDNRASDPYADEELAPELAGLGRDRLPPPDLILDITPPSISPAPFAPNTAHARWIGTNLARKMEPWMLSSGDRKRVCVTAGSQVGGPVTRDADFLIGLARSLAPLDVEVVVAAPDDVAPGLRKELPSLRVGWMPLEVLAPHCDLIIHHGGASTALNAMAAGTPQLVLFDWLLYRSSWRRLADQGSAILLDDLADHVPEHVAKMCTSILADSGFGERARVLASEIAGLPGPTRHVAPIEELVG